MDNVVLEFNTNLMDLVTQISQLCPTSIIANNMDVFDQVVKTSPKKPIEGFVLYVLKYKKRIDDGDESFFMTNSFTTDVADFKSHNTGEDGDIMKKIFEFKSIWKQLKRENKDIVIQYMQILCDLALTYLDMVSPQKK